MNSIQKETLIELILKREQLRPISRGERLRKDFWRTLFYYVLAFVSHIRPYKMKFKTLWGTKMTSFLPEGNTFYYYGYCEANLTNFFIRNLKEGDTFIDIGAHVGIYSMLAGELVGEKGEVHSFEPTPWTYSLLQENVKQYPQVTLNNKAVSNKEEVVSFKDYGPGYGAYNTANKDGSTLKKSSKEIHIKTIVLDTYCKEKNIKPTYIKLDAEGYEYSILQGMHYIFNEIRPCITLEVAGGEEWALNCKQSIDFIQAQKYAPYEINDSGAITPHQVKKSYTYDNIVFIPIEKISLHDNH